SHSAVSVGSTSLPLSSASPGLISRLWTIRSCLPVQPAEDDCVLGAGTAGPTRLLRRWFVSSRRRRNRHAPRLQGTCRLAHNNSDHGLGLPWLAAPLLLHWFSDADRRLPGWSAPGIRTAAAWAGDAL